MKLKNLLDKRSDRIVLMVAKELDIIALERYGQPYSKLCRDKQGIVVTLHESGFLNELRKRF